MGTAPRMTVAENLLIAKDRGQKRPFSPRHIQAHKDEFLNLLNRTGNGLDQHLETPTGLLSGGQRQALSLLMATLKRPELLLLDEHTAALDPKTAKKILQLTETLVRERNQTTLMITHNMKDAIQLGNRLIMMDEGKIVLDLSGEEKSQLTVASLLEAFEAKSDKQFEDSTLLAV